MSDQKHKSRGIYLMPNLLTTAGLFAGFYAIVAAMRGDFELAAMGIFVAIAMDGLDGTIARITNTQSSFGAEYDTLADMVSFGLAPALVIFQWSLLEMGKFGWMAAFIYTACAALRLARFNTHLGIEDKRYFLGLPSPAAAACLAGWLWLGETYNINVSLLTGVALSLTLVCGILMVSTVRYHSIKTLDLRGKVPFVVLFIVVLLIALIANDPPIILFSASLIYTLSGAIFTIIRIRRHHAEEKLGQ